MKRSFPYLRRERPLQAEGTAERRSKVGINPLSCGNPREEHHWVWVEGSRWGRGGSQRPDLQALVAHLKELDFILIAMWHCQ